MSARPARFQLTPKALDDLDDIWRYSAGTWSVAQADIYIDGLASAFDLIAANPMLARERTEFSPPVRIHTHGQHVIIYSTTSEMVTIIRILGGRQDWRTLFETLE